MGILDDAIREHLDLKRRHGADPTEMERLEREALGPVRRGPDGPEDLPQDPETEAAPYDEQGSTDWADAPLDDEFASEPTTSFPEEAEPSFEREAEPSLAEEPVSPFPEEPDLAPPHDRSGTALFDHEADTEAPLPPEPAAPEPVAPSDSAGPPAPEVAPPEPAPSRPELPDHLEEETAEYDVEAEHAHEGRAPEDHAGSEGHGAQGPDEDVLEETPEFLQDTPDHDRLWFEQRPPRDFDFEE